MDEVDVIVIGAGPVGENVADYAHRGGLSVALIESDLAGGECSYWACIPSKVLLRPGAAVGAARRLPGAREAVTGRIDVPEVLGRRDEFVSHYDDAGQAEWIRDAGITLVRGHARLAGARQVTVIPASDPPHSSADDVRERTLRARLAVVVCTGSEPMLPPIPGLARAHPWTSRDATSMRHVPDRLVVIGGGVVACEMATAAASLGSAVTVLVRGKRLLERVEPWAADAVHAGLERLGVSVRTETSAERVDRPGGPGSPVTVTLDNGTQLETDEILVATGRRPRTGDIGLDSVGLKPGDTLVTGDALEVRGVPGSWLFAAGDVNDRAPLTHQGKYQARILGERLAAAATDQRIDDAPWGAQATTADDLAVPQVIFTDPQVATVGMTLSQAEERGLPARAVTADLGAVAGAALHADGYEGRAGLVVDEQREVVLGATFVGQDVAEMLHAATLAIVGEIPLQRLVHAVPAFPTISEVWLRLVESWRSGDN